MTEDLISKALERIEGKIDGASERLTRVEERQASSRDAADHRHGNARMAMDGISAQVTDLRAQVVSDFEEAGERHNALVIRVVKMEDAQAVFDRALGVVQGDLKAQVSRAAIVSGGVGGGIGTGIGATLWALADPFLRKLGIVP